MPVEDLDDGRKRISPPLTDADVRTLSAGDVVVVRGTVFAARDTAHRRMIEDLEAGKGLPFDAAGQILYYVGPTPERPGRAVGAAGPTTASRMDRWTPQLLDRGLKAIIGKGGRGPDVREALKEHVAVYLAALGGGGALAARRVAGYRVIAYQDLGTEAIRELDLDDLPTWVINDATGRDFYAESAKPWRRDDLLPEDLGL